MDLKDIQNNTQGRNILKQVLIIIIQVGVLYVKFTELNLFLPKQPLSPTLKLQHIESISQEMTHFLHKLYYKKKKQSIFFIIIIFRSISSSFVTNFGKW